MRFQTRIIRVFAIAFAATALVACGGDDDDSSNESATDGGADTNTSSDCAGTDLSFTNLETGASGTATAALAERIFDGGLYTVHAADFDIDEDDLKSWRPEVPDGNNVITIQLTVFNASDPPQPVEAGRTLEATIEPDVLTFVTRHFTADDDWSQADLGTEDLTRELSITAVGDTFCFEIDYADQEKEISGTVAAPVFRDS